MEIVSCVGATRPSIVSQRRSLLGDIYDDALALLPPSDELCCSQQLLRYELAKSLLIKN